MIRRSRKNRRQWGGAVLEMALVGPILIMLSFGTVEFGYFIYVKNEVFGAASSGAHAASLPTATTSSVTSAVSAAMTSGGLQNSGYTVTISPSSLPATTGTNISVTVTLTWSSIGINPLSVTMGGISGNKQVTATATMQAE